MNTPILPSEDHFVRLGGDFAAFIESLSRLGSVYLQARNHGGGLGKLMNAGPILVDRGSGTAVDPENGLSMSLSELIAIHAVISQPEAGCSPGFDLDFANRTAGVSFYSVPEVSTFGVFYELTEEYFGHKITASELEEWRDEISSNECLCSQCIYAGRLRAKHATEHPIHEIMQGLIENGSSIRCHLNDDHATLATWMTPGKIAIDGPFLMVCDAIGEGVLHLDMQRLHALHISRKRVDDQDFASLEIYDSLGTMNFEVLSPDLSHVAQWQASCQRSNHLNRKYQNPE